MVKSWIVHGKAILKLGLLSAGAVPASNILRLFCIDRLKRGKEYRVFSGVKSNTDKALTGMHYSCFL